MIAGAKKCGYICKSEFRHRPKQFAAKLSLIETDMSDIIRLLPDSVANQIAAGEVIQRPASVVKELVENSVDAGADHIQVIIRDAGRTLIQVVDNGKGMSPMDARMSFERHATSKIVDADDLFALRTMGFRGEALASIAAVAQVELLTMRKEDTVGTRLVISGSRLETQEDAATAPGANMMVKNLFFNVPARRKFLKKDSVELSNIVHEFERLALVNPGIDFTLIHNDAVMHQLLRGTMKQRIGGLFGKGMERQLVPVSTETSLVKVSGFVGLPENARKRGALQYLFVNGRNMRHPYFHKAVIHCYERLIRPDEQPNYFLNFEVDPSTIDVNIHPTKNEIKFENEQPIWQILVAAIKESLGKYNITSAIDFDSDNELDIPAFNPTARLSGDFGAAESYNPFAEVVQPAVSGGGQSQSDGSGRSSGVRASSSGNWERDSRKAVDNWESLYESFKSATEPAVGGIPDATDGGFPNVFSGEVQDPQPVGSSLNAISSEIESENAEEQGSGVVASRFNSMREGESLLSDEPAMEIPRPIQIAGKYILSQGRNGIMVVNQRRAHIRVLYDSFIRKGGKDRLPSQSVMFPEAVTLAKGDSRLVQENLDEISAAGFDLSYLGDESWGINGVPGVVPVATSGELLRAIVNDLKEETSGALEGVRHNIALNIAKASAMPPGKTMTESEMEHLLSGLWSVATPMYTPDGLRIFVEISVEDLDRMF